MPQLLNEQITAQIKDIFGGLKYPVQVLLFTSKDNCDYCDDTRQLLEEVTALDDRIGLSVYDLHADADLAKHYRVDKAPGIVIAAKEGDQITDMGVQYSGIPSGHEFSTLINAILMVSGRDSGLSPQTREFIQKLEKPLHLQVFVTPTCPYCPRAVLLAYQVAMENPAMVRGEGIEAMEFPELSDRYHVSGVPQTTINDGHGTVVGAVPEQALLSEIMRAVKMQ
ncbi:MAG: thioredoxin family protein [Anaerolineales bacterium]